MVSVKILKPFSVMLCYLAVTVRQIRMVFTSFTYN